jgi:Ca-activated chloride channel family protein
MNFLAPAAFGLAILLPVIIAMYLLKLRRTEREISSVYLWRRMVRDVEANAPWQRLRRNLLLILQLLFLAVLIGALARPFTWAEGASGSAVILIIDNSASMAATDVAPSRLEAAKRQARQVVDDLPDETRVTVISAGGGARVLVSSSQDRRQALLAIQELDLNLGASDLTIALELASAIAARQADAEIFVYSDGNVDLPERLQLAAPLRYYPMGIQGENQAISALTLERGPDGEQNTAFIQAVNYGTETAHRRLVVHADGVLVHAFDLEIAPGDQETILVEGLPASAGIVEARLTGDDDLPLDDRAYAVWGSAEPSQVTLVTEGNLFVETALNLLPGLEVTWVRPSEYERLQPGEGEASGQPGSASELTVFDAYTPLTRTLPGGNLLFIAPPRSTDYFTVTGSLEGPLPRVVDFSSPLLENVSFSGVNLLDTVRIPLPEWAHPVLVGDAPQVSGSTSASTPLIFTGQPDGRRVAVLAFDLQRSDLPLQVSYPLLWANLMRWLAPGSEGRLPPQVSPGESLSFTPPPQVEAVRVTRPDGSSLELEAAAPSAPSPEARQVVFSDTGQLGVYTLSWGQESQASFAVNLFSPRESDTAPAERLALASQQGSAIEQGAGQARREWWRPLAALALAILTAEWLVYQRSTVFWLWSRLRSREKDLSVFGTKR